MDPVPKTGQHIGKGLEILRILASEQRAPWLWGQADKKREESYVAVGEKADFGGLATQGLCQQNSHPLVEVFELS